MDGLGGIPSTTFSGLKGELEKDGHRVVLINVDGIECHNDRIWRVTKTYNNERTSSPGEQIYLVGQSAGGSAVRICAENLQSSGGSMPDGIILLSPAMPRFVWFTTPVLAWLMIKYIWKLLFARRIFITSEDFLKLIGPIDQNGGDVRMKGIPGKEARSLAFYPRKFRGCSCPVLLIYGDMDNWIAPRAQIKLGDMLRRTSKNVELVRIPGSGHVTLLSSSKQIIYNTIKRWVSSTATRTTF